MFRSSILAIALVACASGKRDADYAAEFERCYQVASTCEEFLRCWQGNEAKNNRPITGKCKEDAGIDR